MCARFWVIKITLYILRDFRQFLCEIWQWKDLPFNVSQTLVMSISSVSIFKTKDIYRCFKLKINEHVYYRIFINNCSKSKTIVENENIEMIPGNFEADISCRYVDRFHIQIRSFSGYPDFIELIFFCLSFFCCTFFCYLYSTSERNFPVKLAFNHFL